VREIIDLFAARALILNSAIIREIMAISANRVPLLESLDWLAVRRHYDVRIAVHKELLELHRKGASAKFAALAVGVSDGDGNYSSAEHGLGPKILALNLNAERRVFDLASHFIALTDARDVPALIKQAHLQYLRIAVGSEISCMVNPSVCWVANTRTIWAHLVIKHGYDVARAAAELSAYRDDDATSEMAYAAWTDIHGKLDVALTHIAKIGKECAQRAGVEPGSIVYIWADAIASHMYGAYHD
jgi:hypothetical protein